MGKMRKNVGKVFTSRTTMLLDIQDMIKTLNSKSLELETTMASKMQGSS
jgi:hypothetical protein